MSINKKAAAIVALKMLWIPAYMLVVFSFAFLWPKVAIIVIPLVAVIGLSIPLAKLLYEKEIEGTSK